MSERKQPARNLLRGLKPTVLPEPAEPILPIERAAAALLGRPDAAPEAVPSAVQPEASTTVPVEIPAAVPTVLGAAPSTTAALAVPEAVSRAVPSAGLVPRKHREPLVAWSVKLPASLKAELENISRFNEIPMSEILVEALRRHLRDYEHPPEGWRQGRSGRR